jgi:hypothetical protein
LTVTNAVPEATALFSRHINGIGGREAVLGVQSATVSGTVETGPEQREFTLEVKHPGLILLTTREGGGKVTRVGRGRQGGFWEQTGEETREVRDTGALDLAAFSLAYNVASVAEVAERLAESACEADVTGGRLVFAVGRKRFKTTFPRILFDQESGLMAGVRHARFLDYRPVNGVRVPFIIRQSGVSTYRAKTIRFNDSIPDAHFERPGSSTGWLSGMGVVTQPAPRLGTQLSSTGRMEIVRRPAPSNFGQGQLSKLPVYDPSSARPWQVDLRGADLRRLDLEGGLTDLLHADFDARTQWPARLPAGFDPERITELGKDPGLEVRQLHAQGISGRGIGVGIVDMPLLVDHQEYSARLRLYEEIHSPVGAPAQMHGPAVASIAVGKTCGVAPEAELYYIAVQNATNGPQGRLELDYRPVAHAIHRLLDLNHQLPAERRIRVISISMGWSPENPGYAEAMSAVERGNREQVFVLSTALRRTHQLRFDGLGREAMGDPNQWGNFGPGLWWASLFWSGEMRFKPGTRLCVPMDARATASPTGCEDYVYYQGGGWSWAVPWVAGLYALACQVSPDLTPERFWAEALRTGRTIQLHHSGEEICFGTIADPAALMAALKGGGGKDRRVPD